MAPQKRSKARQQPGSMRSRQQAKLNSQKAQKSPIQPSPRTGPRRQLPPSTEGGKRVGNSSQPWGERQGTSQRVQPVRVREAGRPQLPPAQTVPESRRLPGMQGPQPAQRPKQPGTSRPTNSSRAQAAADKLKKAAEGTRSTNVRTGNPARANLGALKGVGKVLGTVGIIGAMADEVKAMSDRSKSFSWNRPKTKPDPNGRSSTGVRVSDNANKRDYKAAPTGSQQYNDYRNQQIAAERERLKGVGNPPAAKPRASAPQSSSTSRSSTGGRPSRPSTPAPRRIPSPASDAGMKNQDKNYRGNLFEKTFGYKAGGAPDQVRDRTSNLSNKFGQDSGYQPKTKVDGSQFSDKKPDMAKVKEYDRRKRRYYDS